MSSLRAAPRPDDCDGGMTEPIVASAVALGGGIEIADEAIVDLRRRIAGVARA